jgi:hypothetical protein
MIFGITRFDLGPNNEQLINPFTQTMVHVDVSVCVPAAAAAAPTSIDHQPQQNK